MESISYDRLIEIAIALSSQKQIGALLELILDEAMRITGCDAGTVYIRDGEQLRFGVMVTLSKQVRVVLREDDDSIPPVPMTRSHVCACAALDRSIINIPDVYESTEYDFSGAQRYDARNGYRTGSMLVIPMEDERGRNIGVLQLINALDAQGHFVPFAAEQEAVISALASLAAVSLNNSRLSKAVYDILHSFVQVMVDAVDAKSPYNANHTRSMVRYAERFLRWLDTADAGWRFAEEEKDPFLMSVWLHDIGKLIIPAEIMDKPTRLGSMEERILARIDIALLSEELRALRHPGEAADAEKERRALLDARALIEQANQVGFLDDDLLGKLTGLKDRTCLAADGRRIPLLKDEEFAAVTIRRGTLTDAERHEIEQHVVYTARLLSRMQFGDDYSRVPGWASAHHELLDGSGYPDHRRGDTLPKPVRLLTILDIYDALTAEDRPYKPPMPPDKAFAVLAEMRDQGKLDGEILALFKESGAWKKDNETAGLA